MEADAITGAAKEAADTLLGECDKHGEGLAPRYVAELIEGVLRRHLIPSDDAEPVRRDWLVGYAGWRVFIHSPSVTLPTGELLEYRDGSFWIENMRLVRVTNRGQARRLCAALGVELTECKK